MDIILVKHRDQSWSAGLPSLACRAEGATRSDARLHLEEALRERLPEEKPQEAISEVVFDTRW